jgi:gephyrin
LKNYFSHNDRFNLIEQVVICDDEKKLLETYNRLVCMKVNLIVTSGGTGLNPRDITWITTYRYIEKQATGIIHLILSESLKITKFACMSNPICGVKENTLILTLPGSPNAIVEN